MERKFQFNFYSIKLRSAKPAHHNPFHVDQFRIRAVPVCSRFRRCLNEKKSYVKGPVAAPLPASNKYVWSK